VLLLLISPNLYGVELLLYTVEMSASTPSRSTPSRTSPLTVERIVDAACRIIERDGFDALSMRKLGAELDVDPMAVYHHITDRRELLRLVTERTVGRMRAPDPAASWDVRVRQWATGYWDIVAAHRELTLAGLADPRVAAGGIPFTESLVSAITESGLPGDLVEANVFIVVDAVHGAALGTSSSGRDETSALRSTFELGLDTIIAGIAARARSSER
jgi:AcrR family transcriptional regulator